MVLKHLPPSRRDDASAGLYSELPAAQPDPRRVAVLLNRNARRVNDRLAEAVANIVGRENLFYSRNLAEAEDYARQIVQQGYGTVACGGGDGTLVRTYNLLQRYIHEANAWRVERHRRYGEVQPRLGSPRFAFMGLGTGNGMRQVVGATHPLNDLRSLIEEVPAQVRQVPMILNNGVQDEQFCFGGVGYDAMLLNDYNWLRKHVNNRLARPVVHTLAGYFAAMFGRTLPRVLREAKPLQMRLTTLDTAYFVDSRRGDAAQAMPPGTTLYDGPVTMCGMGTTPFYGYGFKVFPFASLMPGMMQLRVANMGPFNTMGNLQSLWRGSYRNPSRIFDFLVKNVTIEFDRPRAFQHSGDDQGMVDKLHLQIAAEPLRLVDLYKQNIPA